jgi:hypothetical protein
MACNLTAAIGLNCKDTVGGIKAIYFSDFQVAGYGGMTFDAGALDGIDVTQACFRYDVQPNTASLTTTVTNEPAGSASYDSALEITLNILKQTTSEELQLLIQTRVFAYILDANDNVYCIGLQNGCTVTAGTFVTGAARADMQGYTLTVTAGESEYPPSISASADAASAVWPFDSVDGGTAAFTVTNPA